MKKIKLATIIISIIAFFATNVANASLCPMMQEKAMMMQSDNMDMHKEHCEEEKKSEQQNFEDCSMCKCDYCTHISLLTQDKINHTYQINKTKIITEKIFIEYKTSLSLPPPKLV